MEFHVEGESGGLGYLYVSLLLLSRLGFVFVVTNLVITTVIAIIAFKKRIKALAIAFSLPLIAFLICALVESLIFTFFGFQMIITAIGEFIFSVALLLPYLVVLSIVIKMKRTANQ